MRAITLHRLILRDLDLFQKHERRTRALNAADPEKGGLCDEDKEDLAARYGVVLPKTYKSFCHAETG